MIITFAILFTLLTALTIWEVWSAHKFGDPYLGILLLIAAALGTFLAALLWVRA